MAARSLGSVKVPDLPIAYRDLRHGVGETFDDITRHGRLMGDPSLLLTDPTRTDPASRPRSDGSCIPGTIRSQSRTHM